MLNLSQLTREELFCYFYNAHQDLVNAENLTEEYYNLKNQIRNTVGENECQRFNITRYMYQEGERYVIESNGWRSGGVLGAIIDPIKFKVLKMLSGTFVVLIFVLLRATLCSTAAIGKLIFRTIRTNLIICLIVVVFFSHFINPILWANPDKSNEIMGKTSFVIGISSFLFELIRGIVMAYRKRKKELADAKVRLEAINRKILKDNERFMARANSIDKQIKALQMKWNESYPEFPMKYAYSYATAFFCEALENYRAENIKELINLFEDALYKERMVNSQMKMIQEQRMSNIIAQQSYYANLAQIELLRQQTQTIKDESQKTRDTIIEESGKTRTAVYENAQKVVNAINAER